MGNKIVTEADRKRSPAVKPSEGITMRRDGAGQKISLERGKSTVGNSPTLAAYFPDMPSTPHWR